MNVVEALELNSLVENITVSSTITQDQKDNLKAKVDRDVEIVDLLSETNANDLITSLSTLSITGITFYHSPLLPEIESLADTDNTHYHLLSVINSYDITPANLTRLREILYADTTAHLHYDEVQFTSIFNIVFQIFSKTRNGNYLAIIGASLLSEFTTFVNKIKIMNDFHFDTDYYIGKYSSGSLVYEFSQVNNWYDVYYEYGNPNLTSQCNYFNGISTSTSSSKSTSIILIYFIDLAYSEKDNNENIYVLMLMMQEISNIVRNVYLYLYIFT